MRNRLTFSTPKITITNSNSVLSVFMSKRKRMRTYWIFFFFFSFAKQSNASMPMNRHSKRIKKFLISAKLFSHRGKYFDRKLMTIVFPRLSLQNFNNIKNSYIFKKKNFFFFFFLGLKNCGPGQAEFAPFWKGPRK